MQLTLDGWKPDFHPSKVFVISVSRSIIEYMKTHEQIKETLKDAMRAKDTTKVLVLRNLLASFTNELVAKKEGPQGMLSDEDVLVLIKRAVKQRKDSIEQFAKGGREDLVAEEKKELAVLEEYLPEAMSVEDIRKVAEAKKAELGIEDRSKMGILMGAVMKEVGTNADGADVKNVVNELLA